MVYKLVEIKGVPRIKLSEEVEKTTIPGRKRVLRVFLREDETPEFDVLQLENEEELKVGVEYTVVDPFKED